MDNHATAKKNVLIVHTNLTSQQAITYHLGQKGLHIINPQDGMPVNDFDTAATLCRQMHIDIVITPVRLAGTKDGIELCAWIKRHCSSMVIIWSAETDPENLERARAFGADHFIPHSTGLNTSLDQLWAAIYFALPAIALTGQRPLSGSFLDVKEVDTGTIITNHRQNSPGSVSQERFIRWADVTHIISYNTAKAGDGNNNLLICTTDHRRGFIYRSSLADIGNRLPDLFVRFDKGTIVNLQHITGRGRGQDIFYIGNLQFRLSGIYKAEVMDKLQLLLYKKV